VTPLSSLDDARALDAQDPLRRFRDEFVFPQRNGREVAYLCGHSLGLQSHRSHDAILESLDAWGTRGVEGHFAGDRAWYRADEPPAAMAASLVGALDHEVAIANALTVNLHLLMASFFRPAGRRCKVLIEESAFPSDRYAVATQLAWHGLDPHRDLVVVHADQLGLVPTARIVETIEAHADELALVLVGGVHYLTGEAIDIGAVVRAGHAAGALVGIDLAHAAGNRILALHDDGVDFAAWCTYKYLNSGPGAVGALFVHDRHADDVGLVRLAGWWGNDPGTRFAMDEQVDFVAARGASSWKISNPPVVSLASVRGSLEVFVAATMPRLRERSVALTATLESLVAEIAGVEQITPADPTRRGAMLTLRLPASAAEVVRRLGAAGIVVDARPPSILRVAPAPLYNTYEDLWRFATELKTALAGVV
jgi:kynureninase